MRACSHYSTKVQCIEGIYSVSNALTIAKQQNEQVEIYDPVKHDAHYVVPSHSSLQAG